MLKTALGMPDKIFLAGGHTFEPTKLMNELTDCVELSVDKDADTTTYNYIFLGERPNIFITIVNAHVVMVEWDSQ